MLKETGVNGSTDIVISISLGRYKLKLKYSFALETKLTYMHTHKHSKILYLKFILFFPRINFVSGSLNLKYDDEPEIEDS